MSIFEDIEISVLTDEGEITIWLGDYNLGSLDSGGDQICRELGGATHRAAELLAQMVTRLSLLADRMERIEQQRTGLTGPSPDRSSPNRLAELEAKIDQIHSVLCHDAPPRKGKLAPLHETRSTSELASGELGAMMHEE